jgi:hypothetical protein
MTYFSVAIKGSGGQMAKADARNFFDGATIASFHRHQCGGAIGGPIKKDKTFFF